MVDKHALIIGASRGLGLGLVNQLVELGWHVTGTVRSQEKYERLRNLGIQAEMLDTRSVDQLQALYGRLADQVFDLIFINAGVFGPSYSSVAAADPEDEAIANLFLTNAIAPIRVAQILMPLLKAKNSVVAFMSSKLGIYEQPDAARIALYKSSKAALNYLVSNLASHTDQPGHTFISFYPGWVKTDMGGQHAALEVDDSVKGLLAQVVRYAGRGGVHFIDYLGNKSHPY